jgi:signal transduction histidine kinase
MSDDREEGGGASARLDHFRSALGHIGDLPSLGQFLTSALRDLSGADEALLCTLENGTTTFAPRHATPGFSPGAGRPSFPARGALARWLRVNGESLPIPDSRGVFDYLSEDEQEMLRRCQARLCVPLPVNRELLAIVLLICRDGAWRGSGDDLELLNLCAKAAALAWDRTRREEIERDRMRASARAQQLAVAGQVAAAMAHEVRNPLTAIRSSVQYVMESRAAEPDTRELLEQVIAEVDRINRTISGVLGFSRPPQDEFVDLDFVEVVQDAMSLVEPYVVHHHIKLERSLDGPPLPIRGDSHQLRQVLLNLLLNACQATSMGGLLTVSRQPSTGMAPLEHGAMHACVTITDSGCGIPAEHLEAVFDPFFTTKAQGSGLGLSICRSIMERHRGAVRLESCVGQGTVASVTLPLRDAL